MRDEYVYESDQQLVADLILDSNAAWNYLKDACGSKLASHRKHLQDLGYEVDDLFSELYKYLVEYDYKRLRGFDFTYSFTGTFLFNAIRAAKKRFIYTIIRKRIHEVSDSENLDTHSGQVGESVDERTKRLTQREALNMAFSLLWERNTQQAYVCLLRGKMEFESKHVATLLGLTVTNVDVTFKRAQENMKYILEGLNHDRESLLQR